MRVVQGHSHGGAGRCQQGVALLGAGVWKALNLQLVIMASYTAAPWAATPHTRAATCHMNDKQNIRWCKATRQPLPV